MRIKKIFNNISCVSFIRLKQVESMFARRNEEIKENSRIALIF